MAGFEFVPEVQSFPLVETAQPTFIKPKHIEWRLWRLDLIYVYPLGMEMVNGVQKEQSCFQRAYTQFVSAKDKHAMFTLHESEFFHNLQWVLVPYDKQSEIPIDGWFQYDYVLDLAEGSEKQYTVI